MASDGTTNVDSQWESFMASLENDEICPTATATDENQGSEYYNCGKSSFTVRDSTATGPSLPFASGETWHDLDFR